MADNVELDSGSGGAQVRTKDRGGIETPVSLIDIGGSSGASTEQIIGDANVFMPVQGAVASGAVSAGNPVLVGGVYDNDNDSVTDGTSNSLKLDQKQNLRVVLRDGAGNNNVLSVDSNGAISVGGSHVSDFDNSESTSNVTSFGIAAPGASGPVVIPGSGTDGLLVNLGSNNDVSVGTSLLHVAGRTTIATPGTATALLADSDGHLQVDVLSSKLTHINNTAVDANSGNKSDGTQRVVIADNDTNLSAIKTAVELIDDAVATDKIAIAGRTTITTPATATALLVDSNGHLQVDVLTSTLTTIGSTAVAVNSGAKDNGTQRVVIATDDVNISNLSSVVETANAAITDPDTTTKVSMIGAVVDNVLAAASTPYADGDAAPLKVTATGALHVDPGAVSLGAGSEVIGKLALNDGVDIGDVDVTSISAGANLIGDVGIQGRTTGGLLMHSKLDYVNTPVDVKSSAGTVYGITVFNMTASPFYIKFYDEAVAVNRATHTPVLRFAVPANASSSGAGFVFNIPQGLAFGSQIQYAITTGVADTDTTGISSGEAVVNIAYK